MLEPRVQAEFDEIRAVMREHAERSAESDRQAKERMDDHAKRMAEIDAAHQKRMAEIDADHRKGMAKIEKDVAEQKKRADAFEKRADERDRQFYRKLAASGKEWRRRAALADERMDKFDVQLQATRKLVQAGMKIVSGLAADTRELKKSQKAFLDSLRNGRNGHGHRN